MKNFFVLIMAMLLAVVSIYSNDVDNLSAVVFEGIKLSESAYKNTIEESKNYNVIYSSFLPADAVYSVIDIDSGKEIIVQIGIAKVNDEPYTVYLPEYMFVFFDNNRKALKLKLKFKFLGWNKNKEEAMYLDVLSLVVQKDKSVKMISKNGLDKHYIQIGAFSYYQNSYPQIIKMLPYLNIVPKFYVLPITGSNKENELYRILAGPYSIEDARDIVKEINKTISNAQIYIHSGESIIGSSVK